ncbi:MAG: putative transporter [Bacteroidaceae bacterium]|nr:putative transporter [Bacteroidaceae bacterium]
MEGFVGFVNSLFFGTGVAHSMIVLAFAVGIGVYLSRVKIAGISFGVTWVLFIGIILSHFGMTLDEELLHFVKEFGLILFVYSIGLQVGPGFFSSLKAGGVKLNAVACTIVLLDIIMALLIIVTTGEGVDTVTGIMSGAVTNTPGMGAAVAAYKDMYGVDSPNIALGYSVAYPLGVIGCIFSIIAIKWLYKGNIPVNSVQSDNVDIKRFSLQVTNSAAVGIPLEDIRKRSNLNFVVSRIMHCATGDCEVANSESLLSIGDRIMVVANADVEGKLTDLIGHRDTTDWLNDDEQLVSRKIILTNPKLNGTKLNKLNIRHQFGINVTRVHRAGIDLAPTASFRLQVGDVVTVVGKETSVSDIKKMLGDERKYLDHPNLIPIFIGIALGCILGSIPLTGTLIATPLKLGLAGGPLIVAILVSYFGPKMGVVTYTTTSANLMIREIGITLFLACVGLGAGSGFLDSIVNKGGYMWILYGALITVIPILIAGVVGRYLLAIRYNTLIGVIAGSCTNPPALAFANQLSPGGDAAVGYVAVYPLAMFLRILVGQMMILLLC